MSDEQCPFCTRVPGVGATPVSEPASDFEVVLTRGPQAAVIPALGMFVPGYFQLISQDHIPSFARLKSDDLRSVYDFAQHIGHVLEGTFGRYLIFEHGSASLTGEGSRSCITHAHWHLIPCAVQAKARLLEALDWNRLSSVVDLKQSCDLGYAFLSLEEECYVQANPAIPGQWIRRMVAETVHCDDVWDWEVYPGSRELAMTLEGVEPLRRMIRDR